MRPKTFSSVIGQDLAVKLIKNAMIQEKLPRTMIFYGPSGVGKTTLARLIAAYQVCLNKENNDVCGKCKMCQGIQTGSITDILEFDAASHTSVDDIREILELCNYAPQFSKEKVFIIDEAHMLSRNAISALLKTFEEAPDHVRFILATTEIEKISNAIKSRCFCIPLKEMSLESIKVYISKIANEEKIQIDDESISLINELSYGSMREALSIFSKAKLLSNQINKEIMHQILSFLEQDEIELLCLKIVQKNFQKVYDLMIEYVEIKQISALDILKQIISFFKKRIKNTQIDDEKTNILKILIDLNKLQQENSKIALFNYSIIIGIVNIAYNY